MGKENSAIKEGANLHWNKGRGAFASGRTWGQEREGRNNES